LADLQRVVPACPDVADLVVLAVVKHARILGQTMDSTSGVRLRYQKAVFLKKSISLLISKVFFVQALTNSIAQKTFITLSNKAKKHAVFQFIQ